MWAAQSASDAASGEAPTLPACTPPIALDPDATPPPVAPPPPLPAPEAGPVLPPTGTGADVDGSNDTEGIAISSRRQASSASCVSGRAAPAAPPCKATYGERSDGVCHGNDDDAAAVPAAASVVPPTRPLVAAGGVADAGVTAPAPVVANGDAGWPTPADTMSAAAAAAMACWFMTEAGDVSVATPDATGWAAAVGVVA